MRPELLFVSGEHNEKKERIMDPLIALVFLHFTVFDQCGAWGRPVRTVGEVNISQVRQSVFNQLSEESEGVQHRKQEIGIIDTLAPIGAGGVVDVHLMLYRASLHERVAKLSRNENARQFLNQTSWAADEASGPSTICIPRERQACILTTAMACALNRYVDSSREMQLHRASGDDIVSCTMCENAQELDMGPTCGHCGSDSLISVEPPNSAERTSRRPRNCRRNMAQKEQLEQATAAMAQFTTAWHAFQADFTKNLPLDLLSAIGPVETVADVAFQLKRLGAMAHYAIAIPAIFSKLTNQPRVDMWNIWPAVQGLHKQFYSMYQKGVASGENTGPFLHPYYEVLRAISRIGYTCNDAERDALRFMVDEAEIDRNDRLYFRLCVQLHLSPPSALFGGAVSGAVFAINGGSGALRKMTDTVFIPHLSRRVSPLAYLP